MDPAIYHKTIKERVDFRIIFNYSKPDRSRQLYYSVTDHVQKNQSKARN